MAGQKRAVTIGFLLALMLGVAVYLRIWSLDDSSFSADDREILRRQFERANLEAMDESAEWRMKYDNEMERTKQLKDELLKVKESLALSHKKLTMMQKEYVQLGKEMESLRQRCKCDIS
ncbi:hypothetical protein LUZ60_006873 [Juncus effusus]|nr:hypothetical protein LUZ60_006873 [Juncus effusus]